MKIYNSQAEIEKDIAGNMLIIKESVEFKISFQINASIRVAGDIIARNINAGDIIAGDIIAGDIIAGDIIAGDINAKDINAWNINAVRINAGNITFYAVCFAYTKFVCKSIKGRRNNSKYFCLDSAVEVAENPERMPKCQ